MSMTWLADVEVETAWAHHAWPEFGKTQLGPRALAVLPIFGFAEHGLGLPLDAEEILGSALLKAAAKNAKTSGSLRVLPPLRFCATPYPSGFFGVDPETLRDLILEIADGVKRAGFAKLVLFVTSPWNTDLVDSISRDVREMHGLEAFYVTLAGLGLNFHPASEDRAKAYAAVVKISGQPGQPATRAGEQRDVGFRPGNFSWPAPLPHGTPVTDGFAALGEAAARLARALKEIFQWPDQLASRARAGAGKIGFFSGATATAETQGAQEQPSEAPANSDASFELNEDSRIYPDGFRARYLPALTFDALEKIPRKSAAWVIIPTAAIEQHGPHLPVGTDAHLGHAWVTEMVARFPAGAPIYVAPPLTFGKSSEHIGFSGTISISGNSLRRVLLALAAQLKALGFRQIAILNSHGGNTPLVLHTLREIQTTLGLRAGLLGQPYKPDLSAQETEMGFHAGEWETSLMLAIASDVVRMDRAVCEFPAQREELGVLKLDRGAANVSWMTADISKSGVMGDATAATREKGSRWLQAGADALAKKLADLEKS
jgi:creatinine amidohydrolase